MKAIAVRPRLPNSVHLREIPEPQLSEIPNGRGVKVRVIEVGVDATDREINEGLYGNPPPGDDYLVIGHEVFGQVAEIGPNVRKVKPGDFVSCTVRRPGSSIFDQIGRNDITSDDTYYERGINLRHGFMTEQFVDDEEFIVRIPDSLREIGVLAEPASVVAKGIEQAFLAQQRLQVWKPKTAFVLGAGQIGILATLFLRLRGLDVFAFARAPATNNLKAELISATGARYVSSREEHPADCAKRIGGGPDLIFEATGSSAVAFDAMRYLAKNGVMIWSSVTGGAKSVEIPADQINLEWVLGNKLLLGTVNGNASHFEQGIASLALAQAAYPVILPKLLTTPVSGLGEYARVMKLLETGDHLKITVQI